MGRRWSYVLPLLGACSLINPTADFADGGGDLGDAGAMDAGVDSGAMDAGAMDTGVDDAGADSGARLDAGADSGAGLDAGTDSGPGLDADIDAGPPPAAVMDLALAFVQVKVFRFTWTDAADVTFYRLLEDPDGSSGYTQVGADILPGTGMFDHEVPLHRRLNASYVLQSCNAAGCTDSAVLSVSGTLDGAIGYVKASNTDGGDLFGWSVALSANGDTLAVGARWEDSNATGVGGNPNDNSARNAGAVYLY